MSYSSEHQRMKPVLDLTRELDIATNPRPSALFEAGSGGFQVWCTPEDHPRDWEGIRMISGAFSKACEYAGSVLWIWHEERIVALGIETSAYALAEQKPDEYCALKEIPMGLDRRSIFNRAADIEWLKEKVTWLFNEAAVSIPPFEYEPAVQSPCRSYLLAHYGTRGNEYVVIVSPVSHPEDFCRPGYPLVRIMEIGSAVDFPTGVILRPEAAVSETTIEPETGPLVDHHEIATQANEDGWLEAAYDDRVSGWNE